MFLDGAFDGRRGLLCRDPVLVEKRSIRPRFPEHVLEPVQDHGSWCIRGQRFGDRAAEATKRAIDNQLLEDVGIDGAKGILVNISASEETLTLAEFIEGCFLTLFNRKECLFSEIQNFKNRLKSEEANSTTN